LEYSNDLSTFIRSHAGKDLPKRIYYKFKFDQELVSLLMSTSIIANLMPNHILNNHIKLILEEFKTCLPSKYTQQSFSIKMFNFVNNLITNTNNIFIGSFNNLTNSMKKDGYIIVAQHANVLFNADYLIVNINMDNSLFQTIITSEYIKFIFDDNVCTIKLGQQVIPDSFDPNPDSGCSNGIHYFRNRRSVFKTYLESYENIEL
jgi:hypothetical protein